MPVGMRLTSIAILGVKLGNADSRHLKVTLLEHLDHLWCAGVDNADLDVWMRGLEPDHQFRHQLRPNRAHGADRQCRSLKLLDRARLFPRRLCLLFDGLQIGQHHPT